MRDRALRVRGIPGGVHSFRSTRVRATVVLFLVLLLPAYPAAAHTYLVSTDPASGATVDVVPRQIRLEFTEEVELEFADATVSVDGGAAYGVVSERDGRALVVNVPPGAADGQPADSPGLWEVGYRVTAGDGHPITGSYQFTVLPAGGAGSGSAGSSAATAGGGQNVQGWTVEKGAGEVPVQSVLSLGVATLMVVLVAGWFMARGTGRRQR